MDPISLKVRKDSTFTQLVEAVGKQLNVLMRNYLD